MVRAIWGLKCRIRFVYRKYLPEFYIRTPNELETIVKKDDLAKGIDEINPNNKPYPTGVYSQSM